MACAYTRHCSLLFSMVCIACLRACIVVDVHSLFVVPKLGVVFALHEKHAIHGMCHTQAIALGCSAWVALLLLQLLGTGTTHLHCSDLKPAVAGEVCGGGSVSCMSMPCMACATHKPLLFALQHSLHCFYYSRAVAAAGAAGRCVI